MRAPADRERPSSPKPKRTRQRPESPGCVAVAGPKSQLRDAIAGAVVTCGQLRQPRRRRQRHSLQPSSDLVSAGAAAGYFTARTGDGRRGVHQLPSWGRCPRTSRQRSRASTDLRPPQSLGAAVCVWWCVNRASRSDRTVHRWFAHGKRMAPLLAEDHRARLTRVPRAFHRQGSDREGRRLGPSPRAANEPAVWNRRGRRGLGLSLNAPDARRARFCRRTRCSSSPLCVVPPSGCCRCW